MAEIKRAVRVSEGLRQAIAEALVRRVHDPRVAGVVVSRVAMTDDLRIAKVYVKLLEGGDDARQKEAMVGLARASGILRQEATKSLGLRYAPELKFFYDDGTDRTARIDELLAQVEAENRSRPPRPPVPAAVEPPEPREPGKQAEPDKPHGG